MNKNPFEKEENIQQPKSEKDDDKVIRKVIFKRKANYGKPCFFDEDEK